MKEKLEQQLQKEFPLLYENCNSRKGSCMQFGFECDDGWYSLLHELSTKLYPLILESRNNFSEHDIYPRASQVKEKFGSLRFYMDTATDEMHDIIDHYEAVSARTCETCGEPGILDSSRNWLKCLCHKHRPR